MAALSSTGSEHYRKLYDSNSSLSIPLIPKNEYKENKEHSLNTRTSSIASNQIKSTLSSNTISSTSSTSSTSFTVSHSSSSPIVSTLSINQLAPIKSELEIAGENLAKIEAASRAKWLKQQQQIRKEAEVTIISWRAKGTIPGDVYKMSLHVLKEFLSVVPDTELQQFLKSHSREEERWTRFRLGPPKPPQTLLEHMVSNHHSLEALERLTPEEICQNLLKIREFTAENDAFRTGGDTAVKFFFRDLPLDEKFIYVMRELKFKLQGDEFHRYYLRYLSGEKLRIVLTMKMEHSSHSNYSNFRHVLARGIESVNCMHMSSQDLGQLIKETQVQCYDDVYPAFSRLCWKKIESWSYSMANAHPSSPGEYSYYGRQTRDDCFSELTMMFDGLIHCDNPEAIPNGPLPQFFKGIDFPSRSSSSSSTSSSLSSTSSSLSSMSFLDRSLLDLLVSLKGNSKYFTLLYFVIKSGNANLINYSLGSVYSSYDKLLGARRMEFRGGITTELPGLHVLMLWDVEALRQLFIHVKLDQIHFLSVQPTYHYHFPLVQSYYEKLSEALEGIDDLERLQEIYKCHPGLEDVRKTVKERLRKAQLTAQDQA